MEVVERYDINKHLKRCSLALLTVGIAVLAIPEITPAQTRFLKGGAQTFDIHSTRVGLATIREGKDAMSVALVGNKIFLELDDGGTLDLSQNALRDPYAAMTNRAISTNANIMSFMMNYFKEQKQVTGQANLTLKIYPNSRCEILSKTLYVPGCKPYSSGSPVPARVQVFLDQIKSAMAAVPAAYLNPPAPNVKAQIMEIVIGRDPEVFPRFATPFDGMIRRDASGKITQVKPLVRDFSD